MTKIEAANREAVRRMDAGDPEWTGMVYARDVLPDMDRYTIGHAGPPLKWEEMCGPLKGAVVGAIRYEGLADTEEEAAALVNRWFEAPVLMPEGLYFPGYGPEDANPDIGDSAITETYGVGGFAMGSAPAVVRFVGADSVQAAIHYTNDMYEITEGRNTQLTMPTLDFQGVPMGIDIRKVVETGIAPVINTGMAHKKPGIGQVGAGIVRAPMDCFTKALYALAEQLGI